MTKIYTQYDDDCPVEEDDTWAIPFALFSQEEPLLVDPSDSSYPEFVEEVFGQREKFGSDCYQWVEHSIVGVHDSKSKREMFKEYFSQKNPVRLFRCEIEFYLNFQDWVDATKPFSQILSSLKELINAVSLIAEFYNQGKVKINVDSSPSLLYFIITPDIFKEVFTNPEIGYTLNRNGVATLAQDHFINETEASYKSYQQE